MTAELESDSYALRSEEIINNIKDELNNYSYHFVERHLIILK